MVAAPLPLPTRFPCWVRAVYSWGGESKRDLGFMEGDLIECLNAGDGSWWTGRLWRDRRAVGLFPSNFVEVLPENFRPTSRSTSPMTSSNTPSPRNSPQKSRTFRKPFEAYAKAPHYTTAKVPETYKDGVPPPHRHNSSVTSFDDFSTASASGSISRRDASPGRAPSHHSARDVSPAPTHRQMYGGRDASPAPTHRQTYGGRDASPAPTHHQSFGMRAASPAPPRHQDYDARAPSPAPYHPNYGSAGPSPEPQEYVGFSGRSPSPIPPLKSSFGSARSGRSGRAHSPAPPQHLGYAARGPSPAPPQHMEYGSSRSPSPAPPQHFGYPRAASPMPAQEPNHISRTPSPAPSYIPYRPPETRQHTHQPSVDRSRSPAPPPHHHTYHQSLDRTRARTPAPPQHTHSYHQSLDNTRSPGHPHILRHQTFPLTHQEETERSDSPPPPPPPPHRTGVSSMSGVSRQNSQLSHDEGYFGISRGNSNARHSQHVRQDSNGSFDQQGDYQTPRMLTPCPPSPGAGDGLTPSPLREAMDDVIAELDALGAGGGAREESPEPPLDPWSPASFDLVHQRSRKKQAQQGLRSNTAMGISDNIDEGYETYSGTGGETSQEPSVQSGFQGAPVPPGTPGTPLPQLSNYVERMESRLRRMHQKHASVGATASDEPPPPPPKGQPYDRPKSSMDIQGEPKVRHKKSGFDVGRQDLNRTSTTKTNSSSNTQSTDRSLMSGVSAGGISATSAGSLARKRNRAQSALGLRDFEDGRPETPFTGVTYHSSHASDAPQQQQQQRSKSQLGFNDDAMPALPGLGGLVQPKPKKQNFIKRILESAKTGVASTRNNLAAAGASQPQPSPAARSTPTLGSAYGGLLPSKMSASRGDMGTGGGVDWVQVRRDINRSNSLSINERVERKERCQMLDYPALDPVEELYNGIDGDEGANGNPVEEPVDYQAIINLTQVDKNSRFLATLPPTTTAITLATTYVCRPYRSDVQRLRAIFTWVAEKICWEEDFEGEVDTRQVIATKRGCAEEYAVLVMEMCDAVGLPCEVVRGYLKAPGEIPEVNIMPRSNHWWNAVLVDNEWRFMDCCLASPSNPRRSLYSSHPSSTADPWWFLTRPSELCWTHIPEHHAQQHMCPPVAHETLLNLPCALSPYFRNNLQMVDYNTALVRIEDLEMVHIQFNVPPDIEVAAEVEVRAYSRDSDGDIFESGEVIKKRALAQAQWQGGVKRYTVKGLLPGDEGSGILKVYAGKRGLMHSIKDIPHPLAFALPIIHTGENPPYEFVTRHPTPHAQRHDIYVVQPQCARLALNNTFVFAIRQHPSSTDINPMTPSSNPGGASPIPFMRPSSAMSMTSSAAGSLPSASTSSGGSGSKKPAKLAIQTPGGKILRLMRKEERRGVGMAAKNIMSPGANNAGADDGDAGDGGLWETIIKCSERGVWRGLVLADRTARWCVFAEWVCEG
ncbi:hypothetical protein QBC43DRAFT_126650 [Cladorrhinum sp. PSN259]|nr:hypothetical protein QBC43DRAFT_126650 [Cladorrhinum sp. PSN259]